MGIAMYRPDERSQTKFTIALTVNVKFSFLGHPNVLGFEFLQTQLGP